MVHLRKTVMAFVLAALFILPLSGQGYSYPEEPCGLMMGGSDYYFSESDESLGINMGRVHFQYGEWEINPSNPTLLGEDTTPIADDDRVCFNPSGEVSGEHAYAWHTNSGWLDFKWGSDDVYEANGPRVDLNLEGELAYTGNAYWSGYVWNDNIGWIQFDWDCEGCDLTQRVHTVLPEGWPDASASEPASVEGFAWNSDIGWINFGGTTSQDLPLSDDALFLIPSVDINPDASDVTKHGLSSNPGAPLADGEEGYELFVQLWDSNSASFIGPDYDVTIEVTPTADSQMFLDLVEQEGDAIQLGDLTYDPVREGFSKMIHSYAPTSTMNGHDYDGDGDLDYFNDPEFLNHYEIERIDISVEGPGDVILDDSAAPLWGLSDEAVNLEFAPAIEVSSIYYEGEYEEGSESVFGPLSPNIEVNPGEPLNFRGTYMVRPNDWILSGPGDLDTAVWFDITASLELDADLGAENFLAVFDSNEESLVVESEMTMPGDIDDDLMSEYESAAPTYLVDEEAGENTNFLPGSLTNAKIMGATPACDADPESCSLVNPSVTYATQISYRVDERFVRYPSNHMPGFDASAAFYNVPAEDPYKFDAVIEGSVTSTTRDEVSTDKDFTILGDVDTSAIRNELFKRFSQVRKGIYPVGGSYNTNTLTGSMTAQEVGSTGELLLSGQLIYFKGDAHIYDLNDDYAQKTVVVEGGDLFIDSNFEGNEAVGVVVFGGNVYFGPEVTDIRHMNLYADGSVLRYDGDPANLTKDGYDGASNTLMDWDLETRRELIPNQFYFGGSMISQNTVGGSDEALDVCSQPIPPVSCNDPFGNGGGSASASFVLPDGTKTSDDMLARDYDLNELSEFVLCWVRVHESGVPYDQDGDGIFQTSYGDPDLGDMVSCPDYLRSDNLESHEDLRLADNEPFHLYYIPSPADLPILGGSVAGGFSIY